VEELPQQTAVFTRMMKTPALFFKQMKNLLYFINSIKASSGRPSFKTQNSETYNRDCLAKTSYTTLDFNPFVLVVWQSEETPFRGGFFLDFDSKYFQGLGRF